MLAARPVAIFTVVVAVEGIAEGGVDVIMADSAHVVTHQGCLGLRHLKGTEEKHCDRQASCSQQAESDSCACALSSSYPGPSQPPGVQVSLGTLMFNHDQTDEDSVATTCNQAFLSTPS